MKKVFIVVLNYNGYKSTIECLESLNRLNNKGIEIETLVVDNDSQDGSVEKIRDKFPKLTIIENQENQGFSGGCNEGIRYALKGDASHIMVLNNDTRVDADLIINLVEASEEEGVAGVVPKIYFEKGFEFHKDKYDKSDLGKVIWYAGGKMDWQNLIGKNIGVDEVDNGQFEEKRRTELATGCCFLIKAEVLKKIGLFDHRYFLYYEDADLSERIRKAGYSIIFEPKAVLWHKNAESSGGSGSGLQDYYISRNRLLFGMTYAPLKTRLALFRESLALLKGGRAWQKIGVRDYYIKKFGKGSYKK